MINPNESKIILLVCTATFVILIYSLYNYRNSQHSISFQKSDDERQQHIAGTLKSNSATCCSACNVRKNLVNQLDVEQQKLHFENNSAARRLAIKNENNLASLQMYIVPQITCSTAIRAGAVADGGKWVCNPWRVQDPCVIYSFGVRGDTSFEQDMYLITKQKCKIYCFDITDQSPDVFKSFNGVFRKWAISGVTNVGSNQWAVLDIAKNFSHSKIDIIKMDIEGAEFSSLPPLLTSEFVISGNICQLLVELHTNVDAWKQLQGQLEKSGFLMFYKEANMFCPSCFEYSYIHKLCLNKYSVHDNVFNSNYN